MWFDWYNRKKVSTKHQLHSQKQDSLFRSTGDRYHWQQKGVKKNYIEFQYELLAVKGKGTTEKNGLVRIKRKKGVILTVWDLIKLEDWLLF